MKLKEREIGAENVIITGGFNQDVYGNKFKMVMGENGLFEVYEELSKSIEGERDNTEENGLKQIDAVIATEGVLDFIVYSHLVDFNEILICDHIGFLF